MKYSLRETEGSNRPRPSPPEYEKLNGPLIDRASDTGKTQDGRFAFSSKVDKAKLLIFGINIGYFSKFWKFVICAGGVFFFYLIYGYLQVSFHG